MTLFNRDQAETVVRMMEQEIRELRGKLAQTTINLQEALTDLALYRTASEEGSPLVAELHAKALNARVAHDKRLDELGAELAKERVRVKNLQERYDVVMNNLSPRQIRKNTRETIDALTAELERDLRAMDYVFYRHAQAGVANG